MTTTTTACPICLEAIRKGGKAITGLTRHLDNCSGADEAREAYKAATIGASRKRVNPWNRSNEVTCAECGKWMSHFEAQADPATRPGYIAARYYCRKHRR